MFVSLGTLSDYMDFSTFWSFAESYINQKVMYGFFTGKLGPAHVIYGADLISLCMSLAAAAYVIVVAVDAGVSTALGLYHNYGGGYSTWTDLLYVWELIVIILWELWAFIVIIVSLVTAGQVWETVDSRIAEAAANSIGFDTAINSIHAVKMVALMFVSTFGIVLSGYALALTS